MKKHLLFLFIIGLFTFAFVGKAPRSIENNSFQAGEKYVYKVKFGFFTIGEAKVDVHQKIFNVNNRPCYRVNVIGKTAGLASLWKVSNTYRSYIDTTAFIPHKFVYSAREGDFKRDQSFIFDHGQHLVKKIEKDSVSQFKVPEYVQDVISGYYFLRTVDFSKMKVGSSISAPLFFDKENYSMHVRYDGKDVIKTKFGKMKVLRLNPVLPKNKLFEGQDAIRLYVSDDINRVPLRLEIDFSFIGGTISMELIDYKNVKEEFDWL
ncbi:MAG: hypothetical protein ACI8UX_002172 [Psychromonas sp.]|jgi:hypothetical protein